jgi:ankyrin repeat protein
LHLAAERGDEQAVQRLLDGGADAAVAYDGTTALHHAAAGGHAAVSQLLLVPAQTWLPPTRTA